MRRRIETDFLALKVDLCDFNDENGKFPVTQKT